MMILLDDPCYLISLDGTSQGLVVSDPIADHCHIATVGSSSFIAIVYLSRGPFAGGVSDQESCRYTIVSELSFINLNMGVNS